MENKKMMTLSIRQIFQFSCKSTEAKRSGYSTLPTFKILRSAMLWITSYLCTVGTVNDVVILSKTYRTFSIIGSDYIFLRGNKQEGNFVLFSME